MSDRAAGGHIGGNALARLSIFAPCQEHHMLRTWSRHKLDACLRRSGSFEQGGICSTCMHIQGTFKRATSCCVLVCAPLGPSFGIFLGDQLS